MKRAANFITPLDKYTLYYVSDGGERPLAPSKDAEASDEPSTSAAVSPLVVVKETENLTELVLAKCRTCWMNGDQLLPFHPGRG